MIMMRILSSKHTYNRVHERTLVCHIGQFVVTRNSEAYMYKIVLVKSCDSTKVLFIPSKVILEMML
jgi:hypothetical protein